jgi:ABC-type glycerol-3-phosphate transport system substrate-binding protein
MIFKRGCEIVLLIFLLTSLVSCNQSNKEYNSKTTITYSKIEIDGEAHLLNPAALRLNYSKDQVIIYDSVPDASKYVVLDKNGKYAGQINAGFKGDGRAFTIDRNNNIYILAQENVTADTSMAPKGTKLTLHIFDPFGKIVKTVDLGIIPPQNDKFIRVSEIAVDSKGNVYLLKWSNGVDIYNQEGKAIGKFDTYKYTSMDIDLEDNLILGASGGDDNKPFIEKIKLSTNESKWKVPVEKIPLLIRCNKALDYLLVVDQNEAKRLDYLGRVMSTLMDFDKTAIGDIYKITSVAADSSDNIYFTADGSKYIQKFSPISEKQKSSKKVLTITTFSDYNMMLFRLVTPKFNAIFPDIEISIKNYDSSIFKGEMDIKQYRDALESEKILAANSIKTLNTEIMSGKGPDIIDFGDKLSFKKYVSKNILLDLSPVISNDKTFNLNHYYTNIINAYKYKNKLYAFPLGYSFNILGADKTILDSEKLDFDDLQWNWPDFYDVSTQIRKDLNGDGMYDRYALMNMGVTEFFDPFFKSCYDTFVNLEKKTARFNSAEFIDLLQLCKSFYDDSLMSPDVAYTQLYNYGGNGSVAFLPFNLKNSFIPYVLKNRFNSNNISILNYPSYKHGSTVCNVSIAPGISGRSKLIEPAWEFIKLLAAEDIQSSDDFPFFPVNKKAFDINTNKLLKENGEYFTKSDIDRMSFLIDNCLTVSDFDHQILMIVDAEIGSFFEGSKTADETANIIQQKVTTYLNE